MPTPSKAAERFVQQIKETVDQAIPTTVNCPACERDIEPQEIDDGLTTLKDELVTLFLAFLDDLWSEVNSAVGDAFDYQP